MKKELIQFLIEHETAEQTDVETVETVLTDYDFDTDNQTDFNAFMTTRYFWNDWNPILTDIY
jgi:hypothetical protein